MNPFDFSQWWGIGLALAIGFVIGVANAPVPAPPTVVGALMVLGMTLGFWAGKQVHDRIRPPTDGPRVEAPAPDAPPPPAR